MMKDIRILTLYGTFLEVEFDFWKKKRCSKCGKKIWLARASNGRFVPVQEKKIGGQDDPVYVNHFSECQEVQEFKMKSVGA